MPGTDPKSPLREITQPFIDVVHAPRALWGVNLPYLIEGMVYFGMVGYLAMYFNEYIKLNDIWAARMVGVLTWGITLAMFFLGGVCDKVGVRLSLIASFAIMLIGRVVLSILPSLGLDAGDVRSPANCVAIAGILVIVCGYGLNQPAAYSAVRQFTSEKTAAMGFAMLYALMNLGGWLPAFFTPVRERFGIAGAFWMCSGFTVLALFLTIMLLNRRTVERAIADAEAERQREKAAAGAAPAPKPEQPAAQVVKQSVIDRVADWISNHP